jgi:hypothetical protein
VKNANNRKKYILEAAIALFTIMRRYDMDEATASRLVDRAFNAGFKCEGAVQGGAEYQRDSIAQCGDLLGAWHSRPGYTLSSGAPAPIPLRKGRKSLLTLAKGTSGVLDADALLVLMIKRKMLRKTRTGLWLPVRRVAAPTSLDRASTARAVMMMDRLLTTIEKNSKEGYRKSTVLLDVCASVPRLPARYLTDFRRFSNAQGQLFAATIDDWLESRNLTKSARSARSSREAGVVAFAFHR